MPIIEYKFIVSPRNEANSKEIAKKYKLVTRAKSN